MRWLKITDDIEYITMAGARECGSEIPIGPGTGVFINFFGEAESNS